MTGINDDDCDNDDDGDDDDDGTENSTVDDVGSEEAVDGDDIDDTMCPPRVFVRYNCMSMEEKD